MSKIDNYIILSVAEKAFQIFNRTNFSTYSSFCRKLGLSISSDTMTQKEKIFVCEIMDEINLIYGLKDAESWKYISTFFKLEIDDFADYNKYIKTMENYHPLLFIDK
jgi:hypothetical protein